MFDDFLLNIREYLIPYQDGNLTQNANIVRNCFRRYLPNQRIGT